MNALIVTVAICVTFLATTRVSSMTLPVTGQPVSGAELYYVTVSDTQTSETDKTSKPEVLEASEGPGVSGTQNVSETSNVPNASEASEAPKVLEVSKTPEVPDNVSKEISYTTESTTPKVVGTIGVTKHVAGVSTTINVHEPTTPVKDDIDVSSGNSDGSGYDEPRTDSPTVTDTDADGKNFSLSQETIDEGPTVYGSYIEWKQSVDTLNVTCDSNKSLHDYTAFLLAINVSFTPQICGYGHGAFLTLSDSLIIWVNPGVLASALTTIYKRLDLSETWYDMITDLNRYQIGLTRLITGNV
uniref:GP116 n=1 Tax=Caviid herpesvirus 2 str. CIDMTR TaxID=1415526 RepID=U6H6U5_9BETA|nr:GP116 [Caviid herpesvirus 2 str. CIDMTR]